MSSRNATGLVDTPERPGGPTSTFRLHDGKITTIMLIFDAAPWRPMAAAIR
ncbi:hypothetical protein [Nonomuraea sp. B19D2]|uniref:hypothetical protein n=1 Tax=Nonomuraea sp. B19D2 TaxID=3159561 RepID=UPI0032DBEA66